MKLQERLDSRHQQGEEIKKRYLTFRIEHQLFGMPIAQVVQIVGIQEITELPDQPDYAKGVISLRGQIIPVVDVRIRFGKREAEYTDRTCIIITRVSGRDVGLIADEVDEVTDIFPERISPPPKMTKETLETYLTGIARLEAAEGQQDKIVLLVHPGRILGEDEAAALAEPARE